MAQYRKKPIMVEAEQWFIEKGLIPGVFRDPGNGARYYVVTAHDQIVCLEPGDWVIAEPDGRGFYPCKDDIFRATFEPVAPAENQSAV